MFIIYVAAVTVAATELATPPDGPGENSLIGGAATALVNRTEEILAKWEQLAREKIKTAQKLAQPVLIDTLPLFLENLAQALSKNHPRNLATEFNNVAQEHGGERARVTQFGPEQILQEYHILRTVVLEAIGRSVSMTDHEHSVVVQSFNRAIEQSMTAYFLIFGRVRDQFVATLSHDLRNPLAAAKMMADLMKKSLSEPVDGKEIQSLAAMAKKIGDNIQRADRMIQNLLDTNYLEIGERLDLHLQFCNPYKIVDTIINGYDAELRDRVNLIGTPDIRARWDDDLMTRAVENLLTNAFKYGREHTPVTVRIKDVLERVMISVHNEGNPIAIEDQEFLFEAFRRTSSARAQSKKGWGLGLAFARGAAESHGGSIGVDSSAECGTMFTIDIPVDATAFQHSPVSC